MTAHFICLVASVSLANSVQVGDDKIASWQARRQVLDDLLRLDVESRQWVIDKASGPDPPRNPKWPSPELPPVSRPSEELPPQPDRIDRTRSLEPSKPPIPEKRPFARSRTSPLGMRNDVWGYPDEPMLGDNEYTRDLRDDPETTFLCKYRSKSGRMQFRRCGPNFSPPTDDVKPPPPVYNAADSPITAFLIDLDGTVYRPGGLVHGAKDFYDWMLKSQKSFMFLSNTGAKTGIKTKEKLQKEPYKLADDIDRYKIHTAAEAQISMMAATFVSDIPPRLFVLSGFPVEADTPPEWETLLKEKNSAVAGWDIRTAISLKEAQQWGVEAETHPTYVVMFIDGEISQENPKPTKSSDGQCCDDPRFKQRAKCEKDKACKEARDTCTCYEPDWSFMLVRKIAAILGPGTAKLAYTADDAFNPSKETINGKEILFPLPGPGMFGAMLDKLMYPYPKENILISGKGGNMGPQYMFDEAILKLQEQNSLLKKEEMAMIGDRFDTDIRGAVKSGINSILVTSGAHQADQQDAFGDDLATWYAADLGDIAEKDMVGM